MSAFQSPTSGRCPTLSSSSSFTDFSAQLSEAVAQPVESANSSAPEGAVTRTLGDIFWEAMSQEDTERVLNLLRMFGPDLCDARAVYHQASEGQTPLHCTANNSNAEIAQGLISLGADVNAVDKVGATPLHCAIVGRSLEVARLLLDNKARVDIADVDGHLPLHDAVWAGNAEAVAMLLVDGSVGTLQAPDKRGRTPEHLAKKFKFDAALKLFAEFRRTQEELNGAQISREHSTVPGSSILGSSSTVEEPTSDTGHSREHLRGDEPGVRPINDSDSSSVQGPTVENLEKFDLDAKSMMEVAIAYAGMDSNCDLMMTLIDRHGAEVVNFRAPRRGGQTCLHRAAHHGRVDILEAAIACNADVDVEEHTYNSTPLAAAAAAGRTDAIEVLIRHGANIDAMTEFGTALHYAAYHGHRLAVKQLVELGANLSALDAQGMSARSVAKARKFTDIARILRCGQGRGNHLSSHHGSESNAGRRPGSRGLSPRNRGYGRSSSRSREPGSEQLRRGVSARAAHERPS